jgi:hypothetical protein
MARAARAEQAYDPSPGGYAPAQGYQAGPGYGPHQGYNTAQSYDAAQGYALAPDYDPEPAYPPAQGHPGGRADRRLHAVPDEATPGSAQQQPDFAADGTVAVGPWDQGTAIRQAAEQEAATIRQQAVDQAAAIRQAAEQEAAQMRAALMAMSDELSRVAAYVSENLAHPGGLATRPAPVALAPSRPAPAVAPTRPGPAIAPGRPDVAPRPARPDAAPRQTTRTARPTTGPTTRSPARPPSKKKGAGRQHTAFKATRIGIATLLAFAVAAGLTEFKLHGPDFFVFRQGGTGQTPGNVTDQQFQAEQAKAVHEHHTINPRQGLG